MMLVLLLLSLLLLLLLLLPLLLFEIRLFRGGNIMDASLSFILWERQADGAMATTPSQSLCGNSPSYVAIDEAIYSNQDTSNTEQG